MRIDRFLYQKEKPVWERMLLFPLYLLSLLTEGLFVQDIFSIPWIIESRVLPCPVISIGNITVGERARPLW